MQCLLYIWAGTCHMVGNIQLISGYRCYADRQVYFNTTLMHPFSCRYSCKTNKHRSFVEFNVIENYCLLGNGPCLWLEPHAEYQTTFIRTKAVHHCIEWLPLGKVKNAARKIDSCISYNNICTVERLHMSSNILPGNGVGGTVYSVLNGVKYAKDSQSFLMYSQVARCPGYLTPVVIRSQLGQSRVVVCKATTVPNQSTWWGW